MTQQVMVRVTGSQYYFHYTDTNEEPIEVLTAGTYEFKDGVHEIRYNEAYEGTQEKTRNTVMITDSSVRIDKEGVITAGMVLEKGLKSTSYYTTPFGVMEMGVTTTALRTEIREDAIEADIGYALILSGNYVADCKVQIRVLPK